MNPSALKFLFVQNYKNIELGEKLIFKSPSILIGANGSGKSNIIDTLKFLKHCIFANPDESRGVSSFEDAISALGGYGILNKNIKSPARVKFIYCFAHQNIENSNLDRQSTCLDLALYVDRETIGVYEEYVYAGEDLKDKIDEIDKIGKVPREIVENIAEWQFYNASNMDLNKIRLSEPKIGANDIYISSSGNNLPLVLDNLCQKYIDFEDSINEAMKSILPKTRRLRAIRSGRLNLTVEWYFDEIEEPFYLSEMSDGTVRMLCWAIILHSPLLPSLLVIDEPELGLHVAWMRILADWIKQAARKTQIIITTHSPDLLDYFTDSLENVLCFSAKDGNNFTVKTLSPDRLETQLSEGWELGDLYRVGDPSVGGWPW